MPRSASDRHGQEKALSAQDPRLARIHALIDTFHPHTATGDLGERFPDVLRRLLDCVTNWGLVNCDVVKTLIARLTLPRGLRCEAGPGGVDEAKSEILDAMVVVADDEHRAVCACCRRAVAS